MKSLIKAVPTLMLIVVGSTSFLLSYVAIRDVAIALEAVPEYLAWAVPVCIDGGILAGSAAIWASSFNNKKRDPLAFLTVAVLLATSVVVNIQHAGASPLAKWIAALPPLILLACLEIVAAQHRRSAEAQAEAKEMSPAPVQEPVVKTTAPMAYEPVFEPAPEPVSVPAPEPAPVVATPEVVTAPLPEPVAAQQIPAPESVVVEETDFQSDTEDEMSREIEEFFSQQPVLEPKPAPVVETQPPVSMENDGTDAAADKVAALFEQHILSGGDPMDRSLASTIAQGTGVSVQYARRVIKPLREKAIA